MVAAHTLTVRLSCLVRRGQIEEEHQVSVRARGKFKPTGYADPDPFERPLHLEIRGFEEANVDRVVRIISDMKVRA